MEAQNRCEWMIVAHDEIDVTLPGSHEAKRQIGTLDIVTVHEGHPTHPRRDVNNLCVAILLGLWDHFVALMLQPFQNGERVLLMNKQIQICFSVRDASKELKSVGSPDE
ncbi:hypothetical protein AURDEDRAFT_156690 [Auricularia subglabra TFB-10046 SS5]|nr:hypothetical protein AURDEDRAFT_156690 [Auricularia subglabra TFB-10046 SS5]